MDANLVAKMVAKMDYGALVGAVAEIRATNLLSNEQIPDIPPQKPDLQSDDDHDNNNNNTALLEALYIVLFNIHVLEGTLICPDTGRQFPIQDGIPNMMLHEDEI
jgi:multifunctional methyltransferase subunit TRM112